MENIRFIEECSAKIKHLDGGPTYVQFSRHGLMADLYKNNNVF